MCLYLDCFEDLSNNMRIFIDYIDIVSQAIDSINEAKDKKEIHNCDNDGFLYNEVGKKIAQIENYKKAFLKYDHIEEDEDAKNHYAYDKNNKKIGEVIWFK